VDGEEERALMGTTTGFTVKTDKQPEPGQNAWEYTGRLGQDPKVFRGGQGMMAFVNLFRPHAGKGTMVPFAVFGELAEKVVAEFAQGDWMEARGFFYSYRDKKTGMLKSQQVISSAKHVKVDEASFRAREAAATEATDNEVMGLF
jgi:hypothetical protein